MECTDFIYEQKIYYLPARIKFDDERMGKLRPESLLNNQSLQNNLDRLRIDGGYDFGDCDV